MVGREHRPPSRRLMAGAVAAVSAVGALSACSSSGGGSGGSGKGSTYKIIYAGTQAPNNPIARAQVTFKNVVEKSSGGRIKVDVHQSGDLGTDPTLLQQLKSGSIQMTNVGPSVISAVYPKISLLGLPFLFPDEKTALAAVNGAAGKTIEAGLKSAAGIDVLAWQEFGMVDLFSKSPIKSYADLKGLKIRCQPDKVQQQIYSRAGAEPTTADITEVYTLMQQGAVSAVPDPIPVALAGKFQEVAKNLTIVNLLWQGSSALINDKFFRSLPSDLQKDVADAAKQAAAQEVTAVEKAEGDDLTMLKNNGENVYTMSDSDRQKWRSAVQPIYESAKKESSTLLSQLTATS